MPKEDSLSIEALYRRTYLHIGSLYPNIYTLLSKENVHSNIANRVPAILKTSIMGKNKAICKNIGTDSKE